MKKLIVNADDFGLHSGINEGIIKGHKNGFISSASLMCSGDAFAEAVAAAKECPTLGVGVHLTLVGGVKPVLEERYVTTLLDGSGAFPSDYAIFAKAWYTGQVKKIEIISELRAQIEKALVNNLEITHIDSHQHTHVLPGIIDIVIELCKEYEIKKIRMPQEAWLWRGGFNAGAGRFIGREGLSFFSMLAKFKARKAELVYPQHFFGMLAGGNLNTYLVGEILKNLPDGISEVMTHPGLNNQDLDKKFSWNYHWEEELQAFLAETNKTLLEQEKITLINFGGL